MHSLLARCHILVLFCFTHTLPSDRVAYMSYEKHVRAEPIRAAFTGGAYEPGSAGAHLCLLVELGVFPSEHWCDDSRERF